jgi:heme exporter protein B
VTLVAVTVFLGAPFEPALLVQLAVVFPLAAIGFSAAGVLLTALTLNSQVNESLLPVLLVPLVVPVILAGIELTGLAGGPFWLSEWFRILLVYDGTVIVTGWVSFEFVIEA